MARFYGTVGYVHLSENVPGVWEQAVTERKYSGDVLRNARRLENGTDLNDNITLNNSISILADAYAFQNLFAIRYVVWMGAKWKVSNAEVQSPRIILTLGGVYNGNQT